MKFITPIVLVLVAVAVFVFYINPKYDDIKEVRAEIGQYDQALDRSKELIALRDTLLARYNAIPESDLERVEKLLPDHVDNVRLILDVDSIASRYGLSIQSVSISSGSEEGELGPSTSAIGSILLDFGVFAPYEDFKNFLMDLEDSLRIVSVTSLSFDAPDTTGRTMYSVGIRTYWLK